MFKWLRKKCYPFYPKYATIQEWANIQKEMRQKKLCYWLIEKIPRRLSVWKMRGRDAVMKVKYRFHPDHQYHIIRTGLSPDYYEIDQRMLYGMFNLLVNYVEVELAWLYHLSHPDVDESGDETGLLALDWQIENNEADSQHNSYAENFKEMKALYLWWTVDRPERERLHEARSSAFYSSRFDLDSEKSVMEIMAERTAEEKEESSQFHEKELAIEEQHDDEDTEMLIRLIRIRASMWT